MTAGEEVVEALAQRQRGRFTRAQVRSVLENAKSVTQSRVRSGRWRRLTSRVLTLPGAPRDWLGDMWTAVLHVGPDAVVSHGSAARLHGLPVAPTTPDCLTLPSGANRHFNGIDIRQRSRMDPDHVVSLSERTLLLGEPVIVRVPEGLAGTPSVTMRLTSLERTIYDLGEEVSPARLDAWLDELTAQGRLRPVDLARLVTAMGTPGRRGVPNLVRVLGPRLEGPGVERGRLERALTQVLRLAGLPAGHAQHVHPASPTGNEFVDRAWPALRLIVEVDGRRWHARMAASHVDQSRDNAAAAAGWLTSRYHYERVVGQPDVTARELREIYDRRVLDVLGLDASAADHASERAG